MTKIDIILCDDHPLIIDGLAKLLNSQKDMHVVAQASTAIELEKIIPQYPQAILLLDFSLPDGDGLELCKKWSKSIRIIGFSGIEDIAVIKHFLKYGAKGYISKSSQQEDLIHAILQVAQGKDYLHPDIAIAIATSTPLQSKANFIPKLSMREKEVLALIVAENTTQEIAEKLFISVNTVESHRNHLLQKLGAKNLAGLVRIALEKGLI